MCFEQADSCYEGDRIKVEILLPGLYPFIPGAVAKGVLVVALTRALRPVVTRTLKERER